jgi:hypothetical protein
LSEKIFAVIRSICQFHIENSSEISHLGSGRLQGTSAEGSGSCLMKKRVAVNRRLAVRTVKRSISVDIKYNPQESSTGRHHSDVTADTSSGSVIQQFQQENVLCEPCEAGCVPADGSVFYRNQIL